MIHNANVLTELFLSVAALVGLWTLHGSLRRQNPDDPITKRFVFGLRVTMLLFAGRALAIITGANWVNAMVFLGAALVPLAVLLLSEGLLRRHAPKALKILAGGGAIVFSILAFLPDAWVGGLRLWGLLVFQITTLAGAGAMIWLRDRSSLNVSENETAGRLALSLILLIPLIGADFLMETIGLPVRLSALGVLALCWLAIGLDRPRGHQVVIWDFLRMALVAVVTGMTIATITATGGDGMIYFTVVTLAAILVLAVLNDARAEQVEAQSLTILRHMAEAPPSDPLTFLRGLQRHVAVEGAVLIEGPALADLNPKVLREIFTRAPVLRRSAPPSLGAEASDHIAHLMDRYAASHFILVRPDPCQLVALAMPSLATSPQAELELQVVQRMARLMAGQEAS